MHGILKKRKQDTPEKSRRLRHGSLSSHMSNKTTDSLKTNITVQRLQADNTALEPAFISVQIIQNMNLGNQLQAQRADTRLPVCLSGCLSYHAK